MGKQTLKESSSVGKCAGGIGVGDGWCGVGGVGGLKKEREKKRGREEERGREKGEKRGRRKERVKVSTF